MKKLQGIEHPSQTDNSLPALGKVNEPISTKRLLSIGKAANLLDVSIDTLRNWEKSGKLLPIRTSTGIRKYRMADINKLRGVEKAAVQKTVVRPLSTGAAQTESPVANNLPIMPQAALPEIIVQEPVTQHEASIQDLNKMISTQVLHTEEELPVKAEEPDRIDELKQPEETGQKLDQTHPEVDHIWIHPEYDPERVIKGNLKAVWKPFKVAAAVSGTAMAALVLSLFSAYLIQPTGTKQIIAQAQNYNLAAAIVNPINQLTGQLMASVAPFKAADIGLTKHFDIALTPVDPHQALPSGLVLGTTSASNSTKYIEINAETHFSGALTGANIINGVIAGQGITVGPGNTPTISAVLPSSLVTSLNGSSNAMQLKSESGSDITLTVSNNSTGSVISLKDISDLSTVRGRGGCGSCITDSDVSDSLTIGATGSIVGSAITTDVIKTTYGGTGLASYTTGDLLYAAGGDTLSRLAIGASGTILTVGSGGVPTWAFGTCSTCLVQSPTSNTAGATGANVIVPDGAGIIGLVIEANTAGGTANLFQVTSAGGSTNYLSVSQSGDTTVGGTLNLAGGTTYKIDSSANANFASIDNIAIGTTSTAPANFTTVGATTTGPASFTALTTSSTVTFNSVAAGSSSDSSLCINGSNQVVKCATGSTTATLQSAYDNGNTIATTTGKNIAFTLSSGTSTSFALTNAGAATSFIINDTNAATNTAVDVQSAGVSKLTILENGTLATAGSINVTGTVTSAGQITGNSGLTVSGGTATLNTSGTSNTTIGNSTGTVAISSTGLNVTTGGVVTGTTISGASNTFTNIPNSALTQSSVTVTAGTGLGSGGAVSLGGSLTLTNAGITSITGTSNQVIASSGTGDVTLSLPQNIHTSATPTFASQTLSAVTNQVILGTGTTTTISSVAPSSARIYTIPDFGSNDSFVGAAATQTLTNKTISGSSNTLSNIGNSSLTNSSITISNGAGISGGGSVSLGGSITLNNAGALSLIGTTNQVSVSAATGSITLTLPQSIGTSSTPTFSGLTLTGASSITYNSAADDTYGSNLTTVTNTNTSGTTSNVKGVTIQLIGSTNANASANTVTGINFPTVSSVANNDFIGLFVGANYTNLLTSPTINIAGDGTITGASFSGSSNTFTSIPVAALTNSSFTINDGTSITGGTGSLGGTLTITNTGVTSVVATTNQVAVSAATGAVTLSLPQNIHTAATPTFGSMNLTGTLTMSNVATDFTTGTNEDLIIAPSGNVGIGTTNPTSLLSVGSSSQFQVDASGNIVKLNNVTYSFPSSQAAGANYMLSNDGAGTLSWVAGAAPTAWSSLTDPSTNLALSMGSNTTTFTYGSTTGSSNLFTFTDSSGNTGNGYLVNLTTASSSNVKPFHVGTGNGSIATDSITVTSAGAVGIGTTSPTGLLSVGSGSPLMINNSGQVTFTPSSTSPAANFTQAETPISVGSYGTWTAQTVLPAQRVTHASAVYNGYVFIVGGLNSGLTTVSTVYSAQMKADGSLGTWQTLTNLPAVLTPAVVAANGYLFVIGGGQDLAANTQSTVYSSKINADGTIGSWNTLNTLPTPMRGHTASYWNGYIFVAGGHDISAPSTLSTVYSAQINGNGTLGTWATLNTLPAVRYQHSAVVNGNYLYIFGGYDGATRFSTVYSAPLKLDGTVGPWTTLNTLPAVARQLSTVASNGYVYLLGGDVTTTGRVSTAYSATLNPEGTIGTWSTLSTLPKLTSDHSAVVYNNMLYLLGGYDGTTVWSTAYSTPLGASALVTGSSTTRTAGNLVDFWNNSSTKFAVDYAGNITEQGSLTFNPTSTTPSQTFGTTQSSITPGSTGTWSTLNNLPEVKWGSAAVAYNGYLYELGGRNASADTSTMYSAKIYSDGTIGAWNTLANLPTVKRYTEATVSNGYLFMTGMSGTASAIYSTKLLSDGTIASWSTINTMPVSLVCHALTSTSSYLFIVGGDNAGCGGGQVSTVYSAQINGNGTIGTWQTLNTLPALMRFASAVTYSNYLFVTGGGNGVSGGLSTVYSAQIKSDGTIGTWATLNPLPSKATQNTTLVSNGYLYVMGGSNNEADAISSVYSAKINIDGTVGNWSKLTNLPVINRLFGGAVYGGYAFIAAGCNTTNCAAPILSTVYSIPLQSSAFVENTVNQLTNGNLVDVWNNGSSVLSVDYQGTVTNSTGVTINQTSTTPTANLQSSLTGLSAGSVGTWATINTLPNLLYEHASAGFNGYVYVLGGNNGSAAISTVYYAKVNADGTLGSWASLSTLPALNQGLKSVISNGYLFVMGGYNGTLALSTVYSAKINTDGTIGAWNTLNTLPVLRYQGSITSYNGYIFSAGGSTTTLATNATSTIYSAQVQSNGTIGTWATLSTMPVLNYGLALLANSGYLYLLGGQNSAGTNLSTMYSALINSDGTIGTWATLATMPVLNAFNRSFVYSNYLYITGGVSGSQVSTVYSTQLKVDGTIGTWATVSTLPQALSQHRATVVNGYVILTGGYDGSAAKSTVYSASLQSSAFVVNAQNSFTQGMLVDIWNNSQAVAGVTYSGQFATNTGVTINQTSNAPTANISSSLSSVGLGSAGSWTTTSGLPTTLSRFAIATANSYVYVLGGTTNDAAANAVSTVYSARINPDGTLGSWIPLNTLPAVNYATNSTVYGNYLFLIGGADASATALSTVYSAALKADGTIGTWNTLNTLPLVRNGVSPAAYNGYLYVFGGWDGSAATSTVYSAQINGNGRIGAWATLSTMPALTCCTGSAMGSNGNFYIAGGFAGSSAQSTVYSVSLKSDGTIGTWNTLNTLPRALSNGFMVSGNGYLYFMGGSTSNTNATSRSEIYSAQIKVDGTVGTWSTVGSLPSLLWRHEAVAANGYIIMLGGVNSAGTALSTVYSAPLQSDVFAFSSTNIQTNGNLVDFWNNGSSKFAVDYNGNAITQGTVTLNSLAQNPAANIQSSLNGLTSGSIGTWTSVSAYPTLSAHTTLSTSNGYLFAVGGLNGSTTLSTVYSAKVNSDGTLGSWNTLNTLPAARMQHSTTTGNGYIFVTGGSPDNTSTNVSTVYSAVIKSDGTIGSWNTLNTLPVTMRLHATTTANGYLFMTGGWNGSTTFSTVYSAKINGDGTIQSWTSLNTLPVAQTDHSLIASNGYLFSMGGCCTVSTIYSTMIQSDGTVSTWTANTIKLPQTMNRFGVTVANGYVYVFGGATANSNATTTSTVFSAKINTDGTTGTFSMVGTMPYRAFQLSATSSNGFAFILGGVDSSGNGQSIVYSAPLQSNAFTFNTQNQLTNGSLLDFWNNTSASVFSVDYKGTVNSLAGIQVNQTSTAPAANMQTSLTGLSTGTIGSWQTLSSLPIERNQHVTVAVNGYLYAIAGENTSNNGTSTTSYFSKINADGTIGSWSTTAAFPQSSRLHAYATYNGYIFVMGGYSFNGTQMSTVYSAKVTSNGTLASWNTLNTLPAVANSGTGVAYNGYLYHIGGSCSGATCTGGVSFNYSTVYTAPINSNGTIGTWATLNTLPSDISTAGVVVYGGYLYVVGGSSVIGNTRLSTVYSAIIKADGTIGTWNTLNTLPGRVGNGRTVTNNGYLYVIGGDSATNVAISSVYTAKINSDGTVGAWARAINLPLVLSTEGAAVSNGYLFVTGGCSSVCVGETVSAVYSAPLQSDAFVFNTQFNFTSGNLVDAWNNNQSRFSIDYAGNVTAAGSVTIAQASTTPTANLVSTLNPINAGTTGTWQTLPMYPASAGVNKHTMVYSGGYLWVFGGVSNGGATYSTAYSAPTYADGTIGAWATLSTMPTVRRELQAAAYNNYVFITGGCSAACTNLTAVSTVYSAKLNIDGTIGSWNTLNTMPALAYGHMSFAANGYLYVMGGFDGTNVLSTAYSAPINGNGTIGTWQTLTATLPQLLYQSSATYYNGYAYVAGGDTLGTFLADSSSVYSAAVKSDGTLGSWRTLNVLPGARHGAALTAYNGYLYHLNGQSGGSTVSSTVFSAQISADGTIGAWTNLLVFPVLPSIGITAVAANGYLYTNGGIPGNVPLNSYSIALRSASFVAKSNNLFTNGNLVDVWNGLNSQFSVDYAGNVNTASGITINPASNTPSAQFASSVSQIANGTIGTWSTSTNLPIGVQNTPSVSYNGYLYLLGGNSPSSSTAVSTIYYTQVKADGTLGTWVTTATLPAVAYEFGATTYGGYLFVGGGANASLALSTTYSAKFNADGTIGTWKTLTALPAITRGLGFTATNNGYLIAAAGCNTACSVAGDFLSTVYSAKINSDGTIATWATLNTLPATRSYFGFITNNNYLYAFGGLNTANLSTVYSAPVNNDGTIGTWATLNTMPVITSRFGTIVSNGYLYMLGGTSGSSLSTTYSVPLNSDGTIGKWSAGSLIPALSRASGVALSKGYIYMMGGNGYLSSVYSAPIQSTAFAFNTTNSMSTGNLLDVWNQSQSKFSVDYAGNLNIAGQFQTSALPQLDGTTGTWQTLNTLPAATFETRAVAYNGYLYNSGGSGAANLSTVYNAQINNDGTIGPWTALTALPALRYGHVMTVVQGYLVVMGGSDGSNPISTVYSVKIKSDGTIGTWATLATMPETIYAGVTATYNDYIFVAGGSNLAGTTQTSTAYSVQVKPDGTLGTWNTLNTLPSLVYRSAMVAANGYLFLMGGQVVGSVLSTVYSAPIKADGTIGTWATLNTLPATMSGHSAYGYNGYLYVFGGINSLYLSTVYSAAIKDDGTIGTWNTLATMPVTQRLAGSAFWNGTFFAVGGYTTGAVALSTVYSVSLTTSRAFVLNTTSTYGTPIGGSASLLSLQTNGDARFTLDAQGNGRFLGNIYAQSAVIGTPGQVGDLAENVPVSDMSIEAGDLVATSFGNGLVKSSQSYDPKLVGVISTKPSLEFSPQTPNSRPVALSGRVLVKVSDENGLIEQGDYLTSSSTPGVAMKATHQGVVVGQALEAWKSSLGNHSGTVLAFIQVGFVDPQQNLSHLSLDTTDGSLIINKVRARTLVLGASIASASALTSEDSDLTAPDHAQINDVLTQMKQSDIVISTISASIAGVRNQINQLQSEVLKPQLELTALSDQFATDSADIAARLAQTQQQLAQVNDQLEHPENIFASASATFANVTVNNTINSLSFKTIDASISGSFTALAEAFLGTTQIADGVTFLGAAGHQIEILGGNTIKAVGTLFVQNSVLAEAVDFFNGLVVFDKTGGITAQSLETAKLATNQLTISNDSVLGMSAAMAATASATASSTTTVSTLGTGKIDAGSKIVVIATPAVSTSSKVFVTAMSQTDKPLSVNAVQAGKSFEVSLPDTTATEVEFKWWIIETSH